jgi:hypothetical protein
MNISKCTVWDSIEQKNLASKIFWDKERDNLEYMTKKLKINVDYYKDLLKKYEEYHNNPVTCNQIAFRNATRSQYYKL